MSNTSTNPEGFDSDRFLRRLERERRLKEIEQTFQNIAEEAKQTQEDIYSNVFTESGQEKTLANHDAIDVRTMPQSASANRTEKSVLSRVSEFVTPNHQRNPPPTFHMSPTGVASFPEIGPVGVAHKKKNSPWQNDGPGFGAHLTNARVQDKIFQSFFAVRSNSKKLIGALVMFCLLVTLIVTLIDLNAAPDIELSTEGWKKLEIIRPRLMNANVDKRRLYDYKSVHFESLAWLSEEATEITIEDSRELLERYVMLVFYFSTKGESWKHNSKWLVKGTPICEWHGVKCNNPDDGAVGAVEKIQLNSNGLDGTMTDEVAKLTSLEQLVLSNNNLIGKVPPSLGELSYLQILELGENELTGMMPDSVCDLKDRYLTTLVSDCGGQDKDIECLCCTECSP